MLLVLLLATGGAVSPLLPLAAAWCAVAGAAGGPALVVVAPGFFVALLLTGDGLLFTLDGWSILAGAACAIVGMGGASHLRRLRQGRAVVDDRLLRLDLEVASGVRASARAEAEGRAEELTAHLEELRIRSGARRVVLWWVHGGEERARPRAVAGGTAPRSADLRGDPLGWVWQEGRGTEFDSTPQWGLGGTLPTVLRVRHGDPGLLLSYEFGTEQPGPGAGALEASAAGLLATLSLLEARAALAHDRRRIGHLLHAIERLPGLSDLDAFGAALLEAAVEMTDGTGAALALWEDETGRVVHRVGEDGGPAVGTTFQPLESEMALAARAGATLDRQPYAPRRGGPAVAAHGELWAVRPRALILVPLMEDGVTHAVLALWSSRAEQLSLDAVSFLEALAPQAARQLQRVLAYDDLRDRSERDPLTQLRNRRALQAALERERARALRYRRSLAVVALDVDHFKSVNDRHGHGAGDAVLRRVAGILEEGVRDIDLAVRAGGEEFILLLPETTAGAARDVAERIRGRVAEAAVEYEGAVIQVRISAGVAAWPESVGEPAELLEAADQALYAAKRGGRDRVEVAGEG